jgi:multidrug efflux pump subunit AcrB
MLITHADGKRTITVSADTSNVAASKINKKIKTVLDKMKETWPAGYSYRIAGEAEESAETFGSAGIMLVVAVILVFSLLVLLFNSFAQSFAVISTMPLALIGTFAGFVIFRIPFSFFAMVGVISLIGIVVNNAIIMIDTMNNYLKNGEDVLTATAYGASERIRPIISTSLTTIVGLTPLAMANPMWRPLCLTIIFGLMASTFISFFVVPSLYFLLTKDK